MAVLITGGAGYIGSHICVELLNQGYEIVVVDDFSNSSPEALKRVKDITGRTFKTYNLNLNNKQNLLSIFLHQNIDSVIHLAGYKSVNDSTTTPLKYYRNNMASTITLLEVMKESNVKKLVFSSSATVYGISSHEPITEDQSLDACNPYGRTKQMIEELLRDVYYADQTWSISILRYFNPIGAHVSGLIGEDSKGKPNNLVPYISNVAVGKLPNLCIYGDDYPTKDGTGIRDYIHVVDLAKGHLSSLKRIKNLRELEVFNLGTGRGYSVMEMIKCFEHVSGKTIPYRIGSRRKGDVAVCFADVSKAKERLGWEAEKGILQMCTDVWRWQQNNPNGYKTSLPHLLNED